MKLYFDVCCFGRLFDAQEQPRVKLEAESVLLILKEVYERRYDLISSEIIELENDNNPDIEQRNEIRNLLGLSKHRLALGSAEMLRSEDLVKMGFKTYDAFHIACAESAGADYFLSTDKKLVGLGEKNKAKLAVSIFNPVEWLRERKR